MNTSFHPTVHETLTEVSIMQRLIRFAISSATAFLIASMPAIGQDDTDARPRPASAGVPRVAAASPYCPAIDPPARPARRAFVDPRTGERRDPTPEEAAQLAAAARAARAARAQALSQLEVVVRPDGSKSIDLKDTFLMDLVAQRNPDGSLSLQCLPPGSGAILVPPSASSVAAPRLEEK